jgi:hypothetical protein
MITIQIAMDLLSKSVDNLRLRRGVLNTSDLEREVINNACLVFLRTRRDRGDEDWNARQIIGDVIIKNTEAIPYAEAFIEAALILYPDQYGMSEADAAINAVPMNVSWEGMWDFLKDYFQKHHGVSIDNNSNTPFIFYSTRHQRYENNIFIVESKVPRTINVSFINDKEEILLSIEPSLSAKTGYLVNRNDNTLVYMGKDPDYRFSLHLDEFDEIETLVLEMFPRGLKIIYS